MRFGSVCSGIEAASVAWEPLGWGCAWCAEIEPFPSAVLAHHYPDVPNVGDFTRIVSDANHPVRNRDIDLLVGGTPCQSFSVAGLRGGLADPRGGLALAFLQVAALLQPRWIVWENVPGVLSADGGRALGAFLGGLGELGYGWAYRVLDAQYVRVDGYSGAVPQRRRRVFVVGCAGGQSGRAAAVLFEPEGVRRDSAPSRGAGEGAARGAGPGAAFGGNNQAGPIDVATACNAHGGPTGRLDFESETFVAHTLRGEGHDASEGGTGRGVPLVADTITSCFHKHGGASRGKDCQPRNHIPVAWQEAQTGCREYDTAGTLRADGPGHDPVGTRLREGMSVRRLTPRECERLQGFPDDYTQIPYRGKPADRCPDGPRYKALGNSMAVNVMRWIGARIQAVEDCP